jgi:hypothetical protein
MIEVRATECGDDTMHDNDRDPRLTSGAAIPTPAHPRLRREPLPWQAPKSLEDDPSAPGRLQAILDSPSYREADLDVAFLNRPESRAVRLQIDYLKPEVALDRLGVRHSVVETASKPMNAKKMIAAPAWIPLRPFGANGW